MRTIAVLNQKGGVGKSTIAQNLAAAAHLAGKRVLVIDLDKQGTSLDWFVARKEDSKLAGLRVMKADSSRTFSAVKIREASQGFNFVLLDGSPRLSEVARAAAVAADLVLLPIQAATADLWAAQETSEMLTEADGMREEIGKKPVRRLFVINRAKTNAVAAREAPERLAALGKVSDVVVHDRIVFSYAMALGESVLTTEPDGASAEEIRKLYKAVCA